uniref:Uncharacterized protein n=1 Tax=Plectus sambesii TaxID=2011161 RepID=A0A914WXB0_9BILA
MKPRRRPADAPVFPFGGPRLSASDDPTRPLSRRPTISRIRSFCPLLVSVHSRRPLLELERAAAAVVQLLAARQQSSAARRPVDRTWTGGARLWVSPGRARARPFEDECPSVTDGAPLLDRRALSHRSAEWRRAEGRREAQRGAAAARHCRQATDFGEAQSNARPTPTIVVIIIIGGGEKGRGRSAPIRLADRAINAISLNCVRPPHSSSQTRSGEKRTVQTRIHYASSAAAPTTGPIVVGRRLLAGKDGGGKGGGGGLVAKTLPEV